VKKEKGKKRARKDDDSEKGKKTTIKSWNSQPQSLLELSKIVQLMFCNYAMAMS